MEHFINKHYQQCVDKSTERDTPQVDDELGVEIHLKSHDQMVQEMRLRRLRRERQNLRHTLTMVNDLL